MAEEGNLGRKSREELSTGERLTNSDHDRLGLWMEKPQYAWKLLLKSSVTSNDSYVVLHALVKVFLLSVPCYKKVILAAGETTQGRKCLLHKCEDKNWNPSTHKRARQAWHPACNLYLSIQEGETGHLRHKLAIKTHQIKDSGSMRDSDWGHPGSTFSLHTLAQPHTHVFPPHACPYTTYTHIQNQ